MKKFLPLILAGVFFIIGLATINDYGMNWDEPVRFMRGQAFVQFFLTGRKSFGLPDRTPPNLIRPGDYLTRYNFLAEEGTKLVELPESPRPQAEFFVLLTKLGKRISFYQHDAWAAYFNTYSTFEVGHLPLPEILGTFSNRVLYQSLGWLGDIDSYHVPYILLSAIGIFVVSQFVLDLTGSWVAALVGGVSLGFFPLFFAESHFSIKNPETAALFAGCVWAFWHWVKENKTRWMVWFFIFFGLSLGVKWDAVFLPFIFVPWLIIIRKTKEFRQWFVPRRLLVIFLIAGFACIAFMLLIWPVSWANPVRALADLVVYYWSIGRGTTFQPPGYLLPGGINSYPILLFLFQTPEIILFLAAVATVAVIRKYTLTTLQSGWLLLLWFWVPIVRYSLPGMHAYSGWRQVMEIVPAIAVLCGVAVFVLARALSGLWPRIVYCVITILYIVLLSTLIRLHPNENVYFNLLGGGVQGAYDRGMVDYFLTNGNVYKQVALWLNAHAERNARLTILSGPTFALSPVWLRPDISISPFYFSAFAQKGEYIVGLNSNVERNYFSYQYPRQFLVPVYQVLVDGVPIAYVYKNDRAHVRQGFADERDIPDPMVTRIHGLNGDYFEVDFGKDEYVTRIHLTNVSP
ncbi:MAG: glycosyltransferase family 39 protein, partial [Candidatus Gottesmanbacteria bacterium]|nr:glycosyltransferase family 39 protein [Candidatus Gottesmanbacteria bacterium]